MAHALVGSLIGLSLSIALGGSPGTFLYGFRTSDTSSHVGVLILLVFTALLAFAPPALGAARPDPTTILRDE